MSQLSFILLCKWLINTSSLNTIWIFTNFYNCSLLFLFMIFIICCGFFFFLPVWALLFGRTLSRSGWQKRSSLGPSWFFCSPHRRAKTVCSPHCTRTSGTPGKLSGRLEITEDSKLLSAQHIYSQLVCTTRRGSHLYNWGPCPQTRPRSQHPPADPWGSNTIYPWKEHQDLSLAQLSVNSTWQAKSSTIHSMWHVLRWLVNIQLNALSTWQQPPIH